MEFQYFKFNNLKNSYLFFVFIATLLLQYLISIPYFPIPPFYFWILICIISLIIIWQIHQIHRKSQELIVLCEIIIFGIILHLIFIFPVPYSAFGADIHFDLTAMKSISLLGWPISSLLSVTHRTLLCSDWPLIHIYGIITSYLFRLDFFSFEQSFTFLRNIPLMITFSFPLIFYIIVKKIYNNPITNLLSTFGATSISYAVEFHSLFVRETIAYSLLFLYVFCMIYYYFNPQKKPFNIFFLLIILLLSLSFAHFLTFFFLIIIALIISVNSFFYQRYEFKLLNISKQKIKRYNSLIILLSITLTVFLLNLIYVQFSYFNILIALSDSLIDPIVYTTSKITNTRSLMGNIIFFLRLFFTTLFLLLILMQSIKREKTLIWDILGLEVGSISFFIIFVNWINKSAFIEIPRIEAFAWPFILISGCWALSKRKPIFSYILVLFILFNCILFPSYLIDPRNDSDDSISFAYKYSDYKIVEWLEGNPGLVMGDMVVDELLGGLLQYTVVVDLDIYYGKLERISRYDYIVIRKENFNLIGIRGTPTTIFKVTPENYQKLDEKPIINKIYKNNENEIFSKL